MPTQRVALGPRLLPQLLLEGDHPLLQRRVGGRRGCARPAGRRCARRRPTRSPPARPPASARWTAASPCRRGAPAAPGPRRPAAASRCASMPGRCAAPPAPAMMTFSPRPAACSPYASISRGIRCADTTSTSCATSNSSSTFAASCMIRQSESLPMTIPTTGCVVTHRCLLGGRRRRAWRGRVRRQHRGPTWSRDPPFALGVPASRTCGCALPGRGRGSAGSRSTCRSMSPPSTLAITTCGAVIRVSPSGRSSTARRCCSNWLVRAPSIVQWPLLCGRIASSLTSTPAGGVEHLDRHHPGDPESLGDAQRGLPGRRARGPRASAPGR